MSVFYSDMIELALNIFDFAASFSLALAKASAMKVKIEMNSLALDQNSGGKYQNYLTLTSFSMNEYYWRSNSRRHVASQCQSLQRKAQDIGCSTPFLAQELSMTMASTDIRDYITTLLYHVMLIPFTNDGSFPPSLR